MEHSPTSEENSDCGKPDNRLVEKSSNKLSKHHKYLFYKPQSITINSIYTNLWIPQKVTLLKHTKHLLILGAGASMSLVPDIKKDLRLPSGKNLIDSVANYHKDIILLMMVIYSGHTIYNSYYATFLELKKYLIIDGEKSLPDVLNNAKEKLESCNDHRIIEPLKLIINYLEKFWYINKSNIHMSRYDLLNRKSNTYPPYGWSNMYDTLLNGVDYQPWVSFELCFYYHPQIPDINLFHLTCLFTISKLIYKYKNTIESIDDFANSMYAGPIKTDIQNLSKSMYLKPLGNDTDKKAFWVDQNRFFAGRDISSLIELLQKYLKLIVSDIINLKEYSTLHYNTTQYPIDNGKSIFLRKVIDLLKNEGKKTINGPTDTDLNEYIYNHLSIITFNYDTTIEYILEFFLKLKNENIDIDHIYGKLEKSFNQPLISPISILEQLVNWGVQDTFDPISEELNKTLKSIDWIRHVPDESDNLKISKRKQKIIEADNIYFLGFGFDPSNLTNIGFNGEEELLLGKKIVIATKTNKIELQSSIKEILEKLKVCVKNNTQLELHFEDINITLENFFKS